MRIAQIAPLHEACPPRYYGGTERVVAYLTEELVNDLDQSSRAWGLALVAHQSSPSQRDARREEAVRLADTLARLPEDYGEVIVLRHLQGLPFAEVARLMGRSVDSVEKLWVRALARLRQLLGEAS